jgi:hypothetical protein
MQKYKFNLWRDMARTKSLFSMDYPSIGAAESDAIKMARALASASAGDDLLDGWIEVQDASGEVQSIVPIRLIAIRRAAELGEMPAQAA